MADIVRRSNKVQALLHEIAAALEKLKNCGETWTVFTNKMALSQEEQAELRDQLGIGSISIKLKSTDEPVEWQESGICGVWYGVFYDQSESPVLETIEISYYPNLAAVQPEDLDAALVKFRAQLSD